MSPASPRTGRLQRSDALILAGLVAFGVAPLIVMAAGASVSGRTLTGATGIYAADQLQYIAWIRSIAAHGLAATNFDLDPGRHVFGAPVFLLSGLVARAGASPSVALLLWLPVAAAALFAAYRQFVRSHLASAFDRTCALCLALFAFTPLLPFADWAGMIGSEVRDRFGVVAVDASPAVQLWGSFPIALTLALSVLALVAAERAVEPGGRRWAWLATCAGAALLASWTHPWQGIVLILTLAAMAAWGRFDRRHVPLALPALAACLPLGYYHALEGMDAAWAVAATQSRLGSPKTLMALAAVGPLALAALPALVRRPRTLHDWVLRAFPAAVVLAWLAEPPYPTHLIETASLPLAVLALQGWRRMPRRRAVLAAFTLVMVLPGGIWVSQKLHEETLEHPSAYSLARSDARALEHLRERARPGAVLAPEDISTAVPAFTERPTWVGHPAWTPAYFMRLGVAERLFSGRVSSAGTIRVLRNIGAPLVLAPCGSSPRLDRQVRPLAASRVRLGCATVYELK